MGCLLQVRDFFDSMFHLIIHENLTLFHINKVSLKGVQN